MKGPHLKDRDAGEGGELLHKPGGQGGKSPQPSQEERPLVQRGPVQAHENPLEVLLVDAQDLGFARWHDDGRGSRRVLDERELTERVPAVEPGDRVVPGLPRVARSAALRADPHLDSSLDDDVELVSVVPLLEDDVVGAACGTLSSEPRTASAFFALSFALSSLSWISFATSGVTGRHGTRR